MKIPDLEQAEYYLAEAATANPGPWVDHSRNVARAARLIGAHLPDINPDCAFRLGLLHDIGRREGVTGMRHVYDGYLFLKQAGFPEAAQICLTHSFPIQNIHAGSSQWDCTLDELTKVHQLLTSFSYSTYDQLIQLCDALALPEGFCLLEKRLVDVFMRYQNYNEFTIPKWQAYFDIKHKFEAILGRSIYSLLPGVEEVTFR